MLPMRKHTAPRKQTTAAGKTKRPQRGLGVAQLERIRVQEELQQQQSLLYLHNHYQQQLYYHHQPPPPSPSPAPRAPPHHHLLAQLPCFDRLFFPNYSTAPANAELPTNPDSPRPPRQEEYPFFPVFSSSPTTLTAHELPSEQYPPSLPQCSCTFQQAALPQYNITSPPSSIADAANHDPFTTPSDPNNSSYQFNITSPSSIAGAAIIQDAFTSPSYPHNSLYQFDIAGAPANQDAFTISPSDPNNSSYQFNITSLSSIAGAANQDAFTSPFDPNIASYQFNITSPPSNIIKSAKGYASSHNLWFELSKEPFKSEARLNPTCLSFNNPFNFKRPTTIIPLQDEAQQLELPSFQSLGYEEQVEYPSCFPTKTPAKPWRGNMDLNVPLGECELVREDIVNLADNSSSNTATLPRKTFNDFLKLGLPTMSEIKSPSFSREHVYECKKLSSSAQGIYTKSLERFHEGSKHVLENHLDDHVACGVLKEKVPIDLELRLSSPSFS